MPTKFTRRRNFIFGYTARPNRRVIVRYVASRSRYYSWYTWKWLEVVFVVCTRKFDYRQRPFPGGTTLTTMYKLVGLPLDSRDLAGKRFSICMFVGGIYLSLRYQRKSRVLRILPLNVR